MNYHKEATLAGIAHTRRLRSYKVIILPNTGFYRILHYRAIDCGHFLDPIEYGINSEISLLMVILCCLSTGTLRVSYNIAQFLRCPFVLALNK